MSLQLPGIEQQPVKTLEIFLFSTFQNCVFYNYHFYSFGWRFVLNRFEFFLFILLLRAFVSFNTQFILFFLIVFLFVTKKNCCHLLAPFHNYDRFALSEHEKKMVFDGF